MKNTGLRFGGGTTRQIQNSRIVDRGMAAVCRSSRGRELGDCQNDVTVKLHKTIDGNKYGMYGPSTNKQWFVPTPSGSR